MIVLILAEIIKNRTRKLKIYLKETTLVYDKFLYKFEFNDIYTEVFENEDYIPIMLNMLDEYMIKAEECDDFDFLDDCFEAKSNIYAFIGDNESCIKESMNRAMLRLNSVYSFEDFLKIMRLLIKIMRNFYQRIMKISTKCVMNLIWRILFQKILLWNI